MEAGKEKLGKAMIEWGRLVVRESYKGVRGGGAGSLRYEIERSTNNRGYDIPYAANAISCFERSRFPEAGFVLWRIGDGLECSEARGSSANDADRFWIHVYLRVVYSFFLPPWLIDALSVNSHLSLSQVLLLLPTRANNGPWSRLPLLRRLG